MTELTLNSSLIKKILGMTMDKTITDFFISLVTIDSESKNEKATALKLEEDLKKLGAKVQYDNAHKKTDGNIGNLYAYFPGNIEKLPILLCAHLDTVTPGNNIKPQIMDDKIFSDGTTILGADDKSGVAAIIWAIKELKENNEDHAPIEALFTISEEIGLLGAKHLDYSLIKSKIGYAFDGHHVGQITIGAPSQNSMKYTIHGKESHAGVAPEQGIHAIKITSEAIAAMPMGRIDEETTCNVGVIKGGTATNIIPNLVVIKAEARSHNEDKLKQITEQMSDALLKTADKYKLDGFQAKVNIEIEKSYQAFKLKDDDDVIHLAKKASENCGFEFKTNIGGGGSDANIFNVHGLKMAVAGTGMEKVHTVDEYIAISDLENCVKWTKEVIREYSRT